MLQEWKGNRMGIQFYYYRDAHVEDAFKILKARLKPDMVRLGIDDISHKPLMRNALKVAADDVEQMDWTKYLGDYMVAANVFKRSATVLEDDSMVHLKTIQRHIRKDAKSLIVKKGKKAPLMLAAYIAIRYAAEKIHEYAD